MFTWGSRGRGETGAAVVETALCLCFIALPLVFATISYAYMLSFRQTVSQSAAEGARAAAVAPSGTSDADRQDAAFAAVDASMSTGVEGLKCNTDDLVCEFEKVVGCGDGSSATCVRITVSYPYRDHSLLPTIPGLGFTMPEELSYSAMAQVS